MQNFSSSISSHYVMKKGKQRRRISTIKVKLNISFQNSTEVTAVQAKRFHKKTKYKDKGKKIWSLHALLSFEA